MKIIRFSICFMLNSYQLSINSLQYRAGGGEKEEDFVTIYVGGGVVYNEAKVTGWENTVNPT